MARKQVVEPTPERLQHDRITEVETGRAGIKAKRVDTQTMLDRYLVRNLISQDQWTVGHELYQVWYKAGGRLYPQGPYDIAAMRVDNGGGGLIESKIDAAAEIVRAMRHLGDKWQIVCTVCICDEPGRDMRQLREGLDRLGKFYGLT